MKLMELGAGPSWEPQVELEQPNAALVASANERRLNNPKEKYNKEMQEVKKALDINAAAEKKDDVQPKKKYRYYCTHALGTPLKWIPMFTIFGLGDNFYKTAYGKEAPTLKFKNNPLKSSEPQKKLEDVKTRFVSKKDQATQTYTDGDPCPLCERDEASRNYGILNLPPYPSVVDPASCNMYTREVAVECPDTTFYNSSQLVFYRKGKYVYRGWIYTKPDGKVKSMPRIQRLIPIDQLRVDEPKRSPAPH